jgi:hypothetical protein
MMSFLNLEDLEGVFESHERIALVYLFGSIARGVETKMSDIDLAVLIRDPPRELLDYYLELLDELSNVLGDRVDLVLLNYAPPLLRHQVIKHGRVLYCKDEEERVRFETRSEKEYYDLRPHYQRYNQILLEED